MKSIAALLKERDQLIAALRQEQIKLIVAYGLTITPPKQ